MIDGMTTEEQIKYLLDEVEKLKNHLHTGADYNQIDWGYILNKKFTIGTAFPTTPTAGEVYMRTDLDCMFYYDDGREAWLSISEFVYQFSKDATLSSDVNLDVAGGVTVSGVKAYEVPFAFTVVGMTATMGSGINSGEFDLIVRGSITAGESLACDGNQQIADYTLNYEHAADSIGVKFDYDSDNCSTPIVCVYLRRRAT